MFDTPTIIILILIGNLFTVIFASIYKRNKDNINVNLHFILARLIQLLILPTTFIVGVPEYLKAIVPKIVLLASFLLETWAILFTYKKIKPNYKILYIGYFVFISLILVLIYFPTRLEETTALVFSLSVALITIAPVILLIGVEKKTPLLKVFLSSYGVATVLFVIRAILSVLTLINGSLIFDNIQKVAFVLAFIYMNVTNIGFVLLSVERDDSKLIKLASIDYVSKINNRQTFLKISKDCIDKAFNHDRPATLIMFDIDDFKKINDVHGHMIGDEVLYELGQLIKGLYDDGCQAVGRFGGDEFAIILPGIDKEQSEQMCDKLITSTKNRLFSSKKIELSISIGVVTIDPNKNITFDTFYRLADEGLYEAKKFSGSAWRRPNNNLSKHEKKENAYL